MPRNDSAVSGVELSHSEAPANEGTSPSTGNSPWRADDIIMPRPLSLLMAILELLIAMVLLMAAFELPIDMLPGAAAGWILSMSDCSTLLVPCRERRVSTEESQPRTMAITANSTATPKPRRTHSPAPRDFFRKPHSLPPASKASASEVAAPAA